MIKNIVFDMGNVLVGYFVSPVCEVKTKDAYEIEQVCLKVFRSQEWILLDMGVISEEDGLIGMLKQAKNDREKELMKFVFWHWHEYNMKPVNGMRELVYELKNKGYGIYLCSNASVRLSKYYKEIIPAIECFDGILISAEELLLKPQRQIYERLFSKFNLEPSECLFIDDLQRNIDAARLCGMHGYCFEDMNVEALTDFLKNKSVL